MVSKVQVTMVKGRGSKHKLISHINNPKPQAQSDHHLKSLVGQVVEKQSDLEQHLVQFYLELLKETDDEQGRNIAEITRHIPKLVTLEHNVMLMRTIDREEVDEAVLQMGK